MPDIRSPFAGRYAQGRHAGGDTAPGVRLHEITGWDLVQAASWRRQRAALYAAVETALGIAPPSAPSRCSAGDGVEILTVAPDRLWCLAPIGDPRLSALGAAIDAETGCITQLGHSHARVRIQGPAARRLLNREIAIDLEPGAFMTNHVARTLFHHVPVVLQCIDSDGGVFDLYLPRTFAASTWEYLLDLAISHGCEIEARQDRW